MPTPNSDVEQTYLTTSQAAERMGVTVETVRQLCNEQLLKGAYQERDNGPWRVPAQSVDSWLQKQSQAASTTFDQSKQQLNPQINITSALNTGGGLASTGEIHTETGDIVGRDQITQGDQVHGDKVVGDKVVGDKHIHKGEDGAKLPNTPLGRFFLYTGILATIIAAIATVYFPLANQGELTPTPTPLPFTPVTDDKFLILITNFYLAEGVADAEPHREIRRAIREQAKEMGMDNLRVEIDPNITLRAEAQEEAQLLGNRYNASLVIWGDETNVRMTVHFLNLKEPDFVASDVKIDETEPLYSKGEPYSRFITEDLPGMLTFLSLFTIGQIQYSEENYEDAIQTIETAVSSTDNKDIDGLDAAYFRLGWLYQVPLNDIESALSYYNQAISLNPDDATAYNNRGSAYSDQEDYEKAITDHTQAISLNPDLAEAYNNRGNAYSDQEEYEQAVADYTQAISLNPDFTNTYYNRGVVYDVQGKYEEAIVDYNQAISLNPDFTNAYFNRGNTYFRQGKYKEAIADYTQAISLNPDYARAYFNRGAAYYGQKNYEQTIADLDQVISLNPDDADVYIYRGLAYRNQGKYENAIADYTQTISLNPDNASAYNNRGFAYAKQGEYEKAIADYNKAISLNPDDADAYYNRGNAYYKQEEYEKAITDYTQAISLNPDNASAYNNRGYAYDAQGQYEEATADFDQAEFLRNKADTEN